MLMFLLTGFLGGCHPTTPPPATAPVAPAAVIGTPTEFYGTLDPFASEAIYFVMTDRFVNGDPNNDQRTQGGAHPTFDLPIDCPDGVTANLGYLGGDFKGLLDHADYIHDMGFGAVWITPIVDNPDEAFSGGDKVSCTSILTDRGKAGYHGYWGKNFYRVDEHLPSVGLGFPEFTAGLRANGLKTVLDIVANHGSPAYTMPNPQPGFGQLFAADGTLIADHQNLPPAQLDPLHQPLHRFFHPTAELAQLSNLDDENPDVRAYLTGAYLQWIDQGAAAFRIDTIRFMPDAFWKAFSDRIRARHPGFFMFGEDFDYDANHIAVHTLPENGAISVLDFPLKARLTEVFEHADSDFALLADALYLDAGPYQNPYELVTFYDNHDMARLNASDQGFIDAHNWLFTARGIPVVYYGSEIGFMRGRAEHAGNRNYFGAKGIAAATGHPIHDQLKRIATLRRQTPALQRGLQINLQLGGNRAAFYRVYQHNDVQQIALVLLNKGDDAAEFEISELLESGSWQPAFGGAAITIGDGGVLSSSVPAHGVQVYLHNAPLRRNDLRQKLAASMQFMAARR